MTIAVGQPFAPAALDDCRYLRWWCGDDDNIRPREHLQFLCNED